MTELFARLRQQKIPVGLLTRNTRKNALYVVRRHQLDFDAIITRHDGPPKPDAYGVLELCRRLHANPTETLVVGDFRHDLIAAKNAGAIAVLFRTHPKAEEYKVHADYCISQMSELLNIIDKSEQEEA